MTGPAPAAASPMFEQYRALKAAHPDAILLFRMGDFFELFFEDAELAARELDLTLTSRNRNDPVPIPMAGVPHHAVASYVQRLVDNGHRVAIAEQTEDPAKAKGLVKREVVRVVTPGVVFDPTSLDAHRANWLAGVSRGRLGFGLAFLDASTGELRATVVGQLPAAIAELERFGPREIVLGPGVDRQLLGAALDAVTVSVVAADVWEPDVAAAELERTLGPGTPGQGTRADPSVAAVLRYARERLGGKLANVHRLEQYQADAYLILDDTTRRNLELDRTAVDGTRRGSLFSLIDLAATSLGSRRLQEWLAFPLLDPVAIAARSAQVAALVDEPEVRSAVRSALAQVADIQRIVARVTTQTAHARDLTGLAQSLGAAPAVYAAAASIPGLTRPDSCAAVHADLAATLVDDPPLATTDGGLIRDGVNAELDELVRLSLDGVSILDRLEAEERERTGIPSLKIRKNRVFGYYIEITTANLHKVPDRYLRKQTLSNCERYLTPELKDLEDRVLGADTRRKELEYELFRALRDRVAAHSAALLALARGLAEVDALTALAEVAVRHRWCRPVVDDSLELEIVAGRHPMVEAAIPDRFVPNDLRLDPDRQQLVVLTGPNMAGKSTVLRQVALITLLAHLGSFVPAESARIGACDRIFTRVGAADDLRRGRSTFMVEMAETAAILNHATARSLVVLDEIGRGTSTFDGLAIAWSVAEDLHDRIRCRGLFATHYHELCALADDKDRIANLHVAVSDTGDDIVFLRRLKDGGASRSYGIQCAKLAGLPAGVIERARTLLTRFEKPEPIRDQLPLFGARPSPTPSTATVPTGPTQPSPPPPDRLRDALRAVDPDGLSPRAAHELIYRLRDLL
ncbi:MAG: DNA mismatch repair protein MutS [Myxococcota bacterium]